MKVRFQLPASPRKGALMGVALLLMLCSGLFLAGWVTMMSTRAIQVSWLESAMQRRIGLENSRLLAWQTSMDHAFDREADLDKKSVLLFNGKAGALDTEDGWKKLNLYSVLTSPLTMRENFPYNPNGLRPGSTYLAHEEFTRANLPNDVSLDSFTAHEFLKSRSPVLNGDLFVIYRKPAAAVTELNIYKNVSPFQVHGRTVVRHPPSLFVKNTSKVDLPFLTKSLYIQSHDAVSRYPVTGTGLDGKVLLPSNLAVVPASLGPDSAASSKLFDGFLNVIDNADNPENSLAHTQRKGAYENIEVYKDNLPPTGPYWMAKYDSQAPPVPPPDYANGGFEVPFRTMYVNLANPNLKHLYIRQDIRVVDQIVFVGQTKAADYEAAGAMSPVIVTLVQGSGSPVRNIAFQHENNRRLILGTKVKAGLTTRELIFSWAGSPILGRELRWRMTLINEGFPVLMNLHDNATTDIRWIGGIMTNWSVWRNIFTGPRSDRLILQSDSAVPTLPVMGASYESLLPREAWLESYFLPIPPDSL
ncbi:MAG: hypothetical protein V4672_17190 [Verrucomicrobiota bacterium]